MKFSIIIPVYNVEKYIDKCLKSVELQTYSNFEVIIVNDGSTDNSQNIIDRYVKIDNRFKSYIKKNGGLSDARNFGLNYVTGDYILFIDSDDYIDSFLLEKIYLVLKNSHYDLIKFKTKLVDENDNFIRNEIGLNKSQDISAKELFQQEYCEPACFYCYDTKFWRLNKFKYFKGKLHEDFGLTPQIIMTANSIYYLNYYGYNYVQRKNSIMSTHSREKNKKKAYDVLEQFDRLINIKYKNKKDIDVYNSFLANCIISKIRTLNKKDRIEYIDKLKDRKVFDLLLEDTFVRKLKKIFLKLVYRSWI